MKKRLLTSLMLTLLALFMLPGQAGAWNNVYLRTGNHWNDDYSDYKFQSTGSTGNDFYYDLPVENITGDAFYFRFCVDGTAFQPTSDGLDVTNTSTTAIQQGSSIAFKIDAIPTATACRISLSYNNSDGNWKWHLSTEITIPAGDADITSVDLLGSFNGWTSAVNSFTEISSKTYTLQLDLTDVVGDQEFKLKVNDNAWIGYSDLATITDSQNLLSEASGGNIKLSNSYKVYDFTATWAGGAIAATGWSLSVVGSEARPDSWTVVGSSADLFGETWAPTATANDMVADAGVYTKTYNAVELTAGNIEYKFAKNHSFTISYPASNQLLNIPSDGKYDITFTYNSITGEYSATAFYTITATKFTVAGENGTLFDGYVWNTEPKTGEEYNPINDMTLVNGVWTITKTGKLLPAGNIQWRVAFDNAWDAHYGGIKGGNGEDKDDPGITNAVVNIPEVGTYTVTFTFDPVTRKVASVATKTADYEITSWCISGNSGAGNVLGGGDWGLYDENLMTAQNDGKTWTLVKTPVTFTKAGTFEFKAFANKQNIIVYPEGPNASMTITAEEAAAGNYTVTFTLDTEAKTLVAEKELILNTYTATFVNTGNWEKVYAFAWTEGTTDNPAWPGKELTEKAAEQVDGHDVYTFSISLPGVAPENIIFNNGPEGDEQTPDFAFVDGKQYSYFTTITVPAITALGYSTYSSEYPLDFTSVTAFKAYIATGLDADDQVIMAPVTGRVPARTGLLLAAAGGCDATEVPVATGHVDAPASNLLVAHVEAGDVEASNPDNNEYRYVLANRVSTGTGFYRLATTLTLPANRAYLQTTTPLATAGTDAKVAWIFTDDGTTNINTLDSRLSTLDSSQSMYNLAGQKVSDSYKGIVIVNGKKVIKK